MPSAVQGPKRCAAYEDLMEVPDTKVAGIIDGELVVSPRPASPRAHAAMGIVADVLRFHRPLTVDGPYRPEPQDVQLDRRQ